MGSYPPPPEIPMHPPEILPPESEANARPDRQPEAVSETRPEERSWAYAPATYVLIAINCLVFLAMAIHHVSLWNPTTQQLLNFGASQPKAVLYEGNWCLVVSAIFVHVGIIHLATNMWCLWNLGLLGEPLIGPIGIFAAYLLSGAAGNLLSIAVNMVNYTSFPQDSTDLSVGAGASGAVFGLAAVLIVLLKSPRLTMDKKELKDLRRLVILFAAIDFTIGFGLNRLSDHYHLEVYVDNMAHLGGFLGGFLFALPLVPMLGSPRPLFLFRRRVAVGLLTAVLTFFSFYLTSVFPNSTWPAR